MTTANDGGAAPAPPPVPGGPAPPRRRRSGFALGVSCGVRGLLRCVATPALWPWAIVPTLLALCFFALPWWFAHGAFDGWVRRTTDELFGETAASWASGIGTFLLAAAGVVLMYLVFAPFARTVAAPFLALLSDRTAQGLAGRELPPLPGSAFVRFVLRPVLDALLFLVVRLVVMAVASPLLCVPVVGGFLWFLVLIPLEGLDRLDVALSSRAVPVGRRLRLVFDEFGACCGLGLVVAVLLLVPFANFLMLPGLVVGAVLLDREISPDFPGAPSSASQVPGVAP